MMGRKYQKNQARMEVNRSEEELDVVMTGTEIKEWRGGGRGLVLVPGAENPMLQHKSEKEKKKPDK